MKKMILSLLLIINSMVADSWVSGWEMGGISTYELTNKKGDTLKIYCADSHTSIYLNEDKSDVISLIDNENMKHSSATYMGINVSGLSDELALDQFLYKVSNDNKFTITMGKQKAEFNVVKNNVNSEIEKSCNMEKLQAMYDELYGNDDVPEQQQEQYVDKPLYKLNPSVHYINSPYQDMLLMEAISLVDGLIVYDVIINNEANGCISTEKAHNEKKVKNGSKVEYKTMKKFEKTIFRYPNNKCEIMQIDVFTNMGNFTHTLY